MPPSKLLYNLRVNLIYIMSEKEQQQANPQQTQQQSTQHQHSGDGSCCQPKTAAQGGLKTAQTRQVTAEEMLAHKDKMMPLVRFLRKAGLKFKHANCMNMRVEYFRIDSMRALLQERASEVQKQGLQGLIDEIGHELAFFKRPPNS